MKNKDLIELFEYLTDDDGCLKKDKLPSWAKNTMLDILKDLKKRTKLPSVGAY